MAKLIMVNYSWLFACQGDAEPFRALLDVWQASETSHSKRSMGNFQHQYLSELLVNAYSYHKVCVCGSNIQSHIMNHQSGL